MTDNLFTYYFAASCQPQTRDFIALITYKTVSSSSQRSSLILGKIRFFDRAKTLQDLRMEL